MNNQIAWFLTECDAASGIKSSFSGMLEKLERGARPEAETYDVWIRPYLESELRTLLNRKPSSNELSLRVLYAKQLGVGVTQPVTGAHHDAPAAAAEYSDYQSDVVFRDSRACFRRWQRLSKLAKAVLMAAHLGMNPEAPASERAALTTSCGEQASIVFWMLHGTPGYAAALKGDGAFSRVSAKLLLASAEREWDCGA